MSAAPEQCPLRLGVDGGATRARVVAVERGARTWRAGALLAQLEWPPRGASERAAHGARCAELLAEALARATRGAPLDLALCMPGRKTRDGRGIAAANHGPLAEDFLDRLERELTRRDVRLAARPSRLFGDGLAAAAGELYALGGALVGVRHGYYVGAGTGLGEAWVLGRELVPLDWVEEWSPKAHVLRASSGESFEAELSAGALERRAGPGERLSVRRARGDRAVREVMERMLAALAELLALRVEALARSPLGALPLERVVLGQRFADLIEPSGLFALRRELARRVAAPPRLVVSHFRAAAAVGCHVLEERLRS